MKKRTMMAAGLLTTLTLGMAAGAFANGTLTEVKAYLDPSVQVNANGNQVTLKDEQGNEVTPLNYNDSIYLPLRGVAQSLGYDVYWDEMNKTALLGESKSKYLNFREDEELILDKYGYSLQIPASLAGSVRPTVWPAESIKEGIQKGKLSPNVRSAIDVLYLPQNPTSPASLIATIEVIDQKDWSAAQDDAQDQLLGSRGDFVYILHKQKSSLDLQSDDYQSYQKIVNQLSQSQYGLILAPAINVDSAIVTPLIGKWEETKKGTLMELTFDGVLYRAGVTVGNYLILDSENIKFVADRQISTVSYNVNGDTLTLAGQTFSKVK